LHLDVSCIDFVNLKRAGIRAVVFDKDNTLSSPYEITVHPAAEVILCVV
jgi:predicted HAD superfamily phosphohydrolase YqeG